MIRYTTQIAYSLRRVLEVVSGVPPEERLLDPSPWMAPWLFKVFYDLDKLLWLNKYSYVKLCPLYMRILIFTAGHEFCCLDLDAVIPWGSTVEIFLTVLLSIISLIKCLHFQYYDLQIDNIYTENKRLMKHSKCYGHSGVGCQCLNLFSSLSTVRRTT